MLRGPWGGVSLERTRLPADGGGDDVPGTGACGRSGRDLYRHVRRAVYPGQRGGHGAKRQDRADLLEHKNGHGQPAEAVLDEITAEQRVDVDAVTGATNSSSVLKKAVENALESAVLQ